MYASINLLTTNADRMSVSSNSIFDPLMNWSETVSHTTRHPSRSNTLVCK